MAKVLIIQAVMKRYRLPFFTGLHDALLLNGIQLKVAYSEPNAAHASRKDDAQLPSDWGVKVKGRWFFKRLLYQPLWREITEADLVIVGPEIKYLNNLLLMAMSALGLKKVAFWGLGPNLHPNRSPFAEWVKSFLFNRVDWWFAYTATIADYLRTHGMPAGNITTVQNATDTTELRRLMREIPDQEVKESMVRLTGNPASRVGFYCGMMQEIKELPFLIESARLVKQKMPEFHLVLIGNGPERPWLEQAIANEPWIHYLGSKYGRESALYYRMAEVFLMGGTAGLAVVDSFAAGLPLLATQLATHPPEISYVQEGENGLLTPHESHAFAECICDTLSNPPLMTHLKNGATRSGGIFTMERMVDNYAAGVKDCLVATGILASEDVLQYKTQST